ncbi:hypothetical protein TWF694_002585 [Orbilia ellipsospora]|uniref:Acyl-CoA synthetase n=1 Tax=Orbilia ellipsospora TaxID=2528407 RepID=A0AAV9X2G1_9PEZI
MKELGLRPHDRVAVCLGNTVEHVIIFYACAKLGVALVPLNPAYTETQIFGALNHISASCIILSTEISQPYKSPSPTKERLPILLSQSGRSQWEGLPSLNNIILVNNSAKEYEIEDNTGIVWYHEVLARNLKQKFHQNKQLNPTDVINIQFTSGTTSTPKAACLTHTNILNNAHLVGNSMNLCQSDIICCAPPIFHCFGIVLGVLAAMTHGCTILFPSESFNPTAVLDAVSKHKATALYGVPTMFLAEVEGISQRSLDPGLFSSLRTGLIGGSIIAPTLRRRLRTCLNLSNLLNIYGMTESSPVCCMTRLTDDQETHHLTVGSVLPHTQIKIVSPDNPQRTLTKGERGELLISGFLVMKGYWKDPVKTAEALIQEHEQDSDDTNKSSKMWLRTGDEAVMQPSGAIQITGRIKDTIIRGGENIYPSEIENILLQHDLVKSVAVVGLPDSRYGEVVGAFIVPKEGVFVSHACDAALDNFDNVLDKYPALGPMTLDGGFSGEDLRNWVKERLSKNCTPKFVFWISQMPLTASGKIEKYKLKEMGQRLFSGCTGLSQMAAASRDGLNASLDVESKAVDHISHQVPRPLTLTLASQAILARSERVDLIKNSSLGLQ